jgi:hypothetical protein
LIIRRSLKARNPDRVPAKAVPKVNVFRERDPFQQLPDEGP